MQARTYFFFIAVMIALAGCASHTHSTNQSVLESERFTQHYKVDTYIQSAVELQSLGYDAALKRLHGMAQTNWWLGNGKVFVLCRMLFVQRPGSDFRGPFLGQGFFLGGTDYSDWPLEPIELVDGVPFLITNGYLLAGRSEAEDMYVHYCETNCDWSGFRYTIKTEQQKRDALNKLINSPKWKMPLDKNEQEFLT